MVFKLEDNHFSQSEFLSLQTSGSTGGDSPRGIHLRWFFANQLRDYHLPLGNKGVSSNLINSGDDYVRIYKLPYNKIKEAAQVSLDFEVKPFFIHPFVRTWTYKVGEIFFNVRFLDNQIYQNTRLSYNYSSSPTDFYKAYCANQGKLAIELLQDEKCFAINFDSTKKFDYLRIETFSKTIVNGDEHEALSNRIDGEYQEDGLLRRIQEEGLLGENMIRLVFQFRGDSVEKVPSQFSFYLYSRAIKTFEKENADRQLSLIDNLQKEWETITDDLQLKKWYRWKNNIMLSVGNYKIKYEEEEGIRKSLHNLIDPNSDFIKYLYRKLASNQTTDSIVRSFKAIQLASLDFHVARMLGFGYTDNLQEEKDKGQYIYLMEYQIKKPDEVISALSAIPNGQHLYLSLPTSAKYDKESEAVELLPVRYGFVGQNDTILDENGYALDELSRYIRLHCEKVDYQKSDSFFEPGLIFSAAHLSPSVFAGVLGSKIKEGVIEAKKDLSLSKPYGYPDEEVTSFLIQNSILDPTFLHKLEYPDDHESIYKYSVYPIDVFARAGFESNEKLTDTTAFGIPNLLLPPSSLSVQLIQEENPLILTTEADQSRLKEIDGEDKTLVKVTFDYNHIHDINSCKLNSREADHFGEFAEFLFRPNLPRILPKIVSGEEGEENQDASTVKFGFHTDNKSIINLSSHPIEGGSIANFEGGIFSTNGYRFKITEVINPSRIRASPIQSSTFITTDNGIVSNSRDEEYPIDLLTSTPASRYYTLHENMEKSSSWDQPNPLLFTAKIDFEEADMPGWGKRDIRWTEEIEGNREVVDRTLRGFWGEASIDGPEEGIYQVTFVDIDHPTHPQQSPNGNSIAFDKGILRVPSRGNEQWKVLEVLRIESQEGERLQLKVVNNTGDSEFQIGDNIEVNYYPSYKCYLVAEEGVGRIFNKNNILPQEGRTKTTILSLRVAGENPNEEGLTWYSPLSKPSLLKAEKRIVAFSPETIFFDPSKSIFATPPDAFSKSTFSFKLPITTEPYQVVVYRADVTAVLSALYTPETIREIKSQLDYSDTWFTQRLYDFVNLVYVEEENEFLFKRYIGSSTPDYQLPNPDRENINPENYQKEIWNSFLPITENPILFSDVIANTKISREKPVMLIPSAGEDQQKLLITDFNLDGEKVTSYFYMVRTIGTGYDISEPNTIIGPVQLINNRPPKAPIIKNVFVQYDDNFKPQVKFSLRSYEDQINIKKIEVRSTYSSLKSRSWRLMDAKETIKGEQEPWTVIDASFPEEHADIQFGETLFYRLNVHKEISYTRVGEAAPRPDLIPSVASKVFSIRLVDNKTPDSPDLRIKPNNDFFCKKTCYQGTYILERLNRRGIWKLVANNIKPLGRQIQLAQLEEELSPGVFLKYRIKVINTNGLDSGWSRVFVFSAREDGSIRRVN